MYLLFLQIPYPSTPSFETITGYYSTGLGLVDIDGNGYKDIIISNGNDMATQKNGIYYNSNGNPSLSPSWLSNDAQCHGHLSIGDVNGDRLLDVAVAGFSCYYQSWSKQKSVLYLNTPNGLNPNPAWVSDTSRCFGVATSDVNGDGYNDFAFFCGNGYNNVPEPIKLYLSNGNNLNNNPDWQSLDSVFSYGGKFFDVDNDGDLDLFVGLENDKARLYLNNNGVLSSIQDWQSNVVGYGNQVAVGDVNNDSYLDVVVANTYQNESLSNVHIYINNNGVLNPNPIVISNIGNYISAVALGDVDGDGYLDLAVGGWWNSLYVFKNQGGNFTNPSWIFNIGNNLVSEYIYFADLDNAYIIDTFETFNINSPDYHVFTLKHKPIHSIDSIYLNNSLYNSHFAYSEEDGWVSIPKTALNGISKVKIVYKYSKSLDMVVSNWNPNRGSFGFMNQNSSLKESFKLSIKDGIYDVLGRKVKTIKKGIYFKCEGGKVKKIFRPL